MPDHRLPAERRTSRIAASSARPSVVPFEYDLLLVPAIFRELLTIGGDHQVQPTDVCVHIVLSVLRTRLQDALHLFLHVAAGALPAFMRAAQRDHIMEVRILSRDLFKEIAIVDLTLIAGSEDPPYPPALMMRRVAEQPFDKDAHGRHPRPGSDHQRIAQRIAQDEVAV